MAFVRPLNSIVRPQRKFSVAEGRELRRIEPWRLWLGRILIIPLCAMSGGMIFALYKILVAGEIHYTSRGYRPISRVYSFDESPVSFLLFFALYAALAGVIIFVTIHVARRFAKGTQPT